jgi:hypothetical protein
MGPCGRGTVPCARHCCGPRKRRPSRPCKWAGVPSIWRSLGGARSPVPVHAAAQAALESRRPRRLKRLGRRTPAGRGTVPCARHCCGPRKRRPSHATLWGGHSPLCPIFCGRRGRRPSRPVGARKGTGRLSRAAGSARAPVSAFSCGPQGHGPSQGTLRERHSALCPIFLRTAGTPSLPACRSSQEHPAIGCGCRFRRGDHGLPFLVDREDAVPPDLSNGLGCFRSGDSPGGARSPVPVHAAAQAALESRRPWRLKILGRGTPAGRGTVPCARMFLWTVRIRPPNLRRHTHGGTVAVLAHPMGSRSLLRW